MKREKKYYSFAALSAQYIMPRDEVIDPIDAAVCMCDGGVYI
jgi:hypothetical protein